MANVVRNLRKSKNVWAKPSTYSIALVALLCSVIIFMVFGQTTSWYHSKLTAAEKSWLRPASDDSASTSKVGSADRQTRSDEKMTVMQQLSQSATFFSTLTELYGKYGNEIAAFRPEMRVWC